MPNLQLLDLLVRTEELGSLSKAAAAMGLAQPNASRALARFERKIGQPLLARSSSGSKLTSTGALVAGWARPLLAASEEFEAAMASLRKDATDRLQVLASQTIAESYAPAWLARFQACRPQVRVHLEVANSAAIMERILAGDSRLGLVESATIRPGLHTQAIGHDQLILICPPTHPWARRRSPVSLKQLAGTPLVVREEGSGTRQVLELALAQFTAARPALVASSNAAVIGSVSAGAGPAVISRKSAASALTQGIVCAVGVEHSDQLRRTLRAVWASGKAPVGAAAHFVEATRPALPPRPQ